MTTPRQSAEDALNRAVKGEPVLLGTAIVNFVAVALATAAMFGFHTTPEQQDAIWQLLAAFSILLWAGAGFIRQSVYSPATHEREMAQAQSNLED